MGGKPSKGTSADGRLKTNKSAPAKKASGTSSSAKPAFGSPEFNAKYGGKSKGKGK